MNNNSSRSNDNSEDSESQPVAVSRNEGAEFLSTSRHRGGGGWCTSVAVPVLALGNTFCLLVLFALLGMGFAVLWGQVQYLTHRMIAQQKQIANLQLEISEKENTEIEKLSVEVEQQQDYTLYQLAGTFTLLTCLLTIFHMASHIRNMYEPIVQRKILAILWMSPIYGVTSFVSLLVPATEGYLSIIKDFYEAYVIYTFLSFLISVLGRGDRTLVVNAVAQHVGHLDEPTRCFRRCYNPPPETSDAARANAILTECQILAMQFVLVRPLTSIASFLLFTLTHESDTTASENQQSAAASYFMSPGFVITLIENISVFCAFTGLIKFYHAVRDDLAWLQPFNKFLAIKGIVFLTFWQGLVVSIIVHLHGHADNSNAAGGDASSNSSKTKDSHGQALAIQNLLICVEMLFFSLAHWCVFPSEEWEPNYRPKQYAKPGLGIRDFAKDVRGIMRRGPPGASPLSQDPLGMDMDTGIEAENGLGMPDPVDDIEGRKII